MNILVIGGFLGSGKTTLIQALIKGVIDAGQSCAIIENEIGEVGIDDALIEEAGLEVTTLFGGCVCCQISGNLIVAVQRIEKEIAPDWLIIEMTGLAFMDSMREVFEMAHWPSERIHTVSVADMSRWKHLMGPLSRVFEHQVAGADVILLNKTDVAAPTEETYEAVRSLNASGAIIELDAQAKVPAVLFEKLLEGFSRQRSGVQ